VDDLKKTKGYCKLKEEAPDRTVWGTEFEKGCGPVVRQTGRLRGRGRVDQGYGRKPFCLNLDRNPL
jgi:hypothetical protein